MSGCIRIPCGICTISGSPGNSCEARSGALEIVVFQGCRILVMQLLLVQDDPELQNDPLSKLDLAAFVGEQLRSIYQNDESFFNLCCSNLGPAQLAAVKQCFQQ